MSKSFAFYVPISMSLELMILIEDSLVEWKSLMPIGNCRFGDPLVASFHRRRNQAIGGYYRSGPATANLFPSSLVSAFQSKDIS
jgi:hypothetical protein